MKQNISLSILSVKENPLPALRQYKESIEKLCSLKRKNSFRYIVHLDVMDGKFVSNIGVDLEYIKTAKNMGFYVDTHLMVENPIGDKYVEKALEYGTDDITIHYEIKNFESILKYLNERKTILKERDNRELNIGVSIKPSTSVEEVLKYKEQFSKLLVMSVEPGYGSQQYIEKTDKKLKIAREKLPHHVIQVDGGINFKTIKNALNSNVDSIVVGSYLSIADNIYNRLLSLEIEKDIESLPKDSNIEFDTKLLQILPGGYGEGDILIGITTPNIRKLSNSWYKNLNLDVIDDFISSKYHEYRKFACICMSNLMKYFVSNKSTKIFEFYKEDVIKCFEKNLEYIDNWDLTDEVAPNVLGKYLVNEKEKKVKDILNKYISNKNIWIRRIGMVSCLEFARLGYKEIPFWVSDVLLYDEEMLINKAVGWVLREVYKKHPSEVLKYLCEKNREKAIPRFVVSYASEKMCKEEKIKIKERE